MAREAAVESRYNSLQQPMVGRKNKLSEAYRLFQFFRDIEDEEDWIHEKEPLVSSTNRGRDLIGVQNLIQKHQALMHEITSHEDRIQQVYKQGMYSYTYRPLCNETFDKDATALVLVQ